MLSSLDRIQVVVPDRPAAAVRWAELFGAEKVAEDGSRYLNAHRTTLQVGISLVELLEPAGPGPIADYAARWKQGLYGVGFATPHMEAMAKHFDALGVGYAKEGGALYLASDATHGMPTVIVPREYRARVGHVRSIYEVTNPVADAAATSAHYARLFGLDAGRFCPIRSDLYGYTGTLTLFNPPAQLDRVEITQTFGGGAMDRFYQRRGPSLYMCYLEVDDVPALGRRLEARGDRYTGGEDHPPEHGLFIHPSALDGMLMGVSRTNYAWVWSGHPELAGEGAEGFVH